MSTFILQNANNYFIICLGGDDMSNLFFKENLLYLRKQKNQSQTELGKALGVTRHAISKWENGERMPIIEDAQNIAKYFDISLENLLCDDLSSITETLLITGKELELIKIYRELTNNQKEALFTMILGMVNK
jgi:transcriptional regulator with XRE-family HTH domain